ncbi:MAG: hypothetical protein AAFQ98_07530 [Bacteroidota bacterium]
MQSKSIAFLLILGMGSLFGCDLIDTLEPSFESTATIEGFDMTLCGCCGGYIINIEGQDGIRRFEVLPSGSDIDLETADYPISVKLDWSDSDAYCGNGIVVEAIELVK